MEQCSGNNVGALTSTTLTPDDLRVPNDDEVTAKQPNAQASTAKLENCQSSLSGIAGVPHFEKSFERL